MKKINLIEILEDFGICDNSTYPNEQVREKHLVIIAAMKEACKQALELAAKNAFVNNIHTFEYYDSEYDLKDDKMEYVIETDGDGCPCSIRIFAVDQTSIINTINQIQ